MFSVGDVVKTLHVLFERTVMVERYDQSMYKNTKSTYFPVHLAGTALG